MTGHDPDTNAYIFEILKVTKMQTFLEQLCIDARYWLPVSRFQFYDQVHSTNGMHYAYTMKQHYSL